MELNEFETWKMAKPLGMAYLSTEACNVCKVLKPKMLALVEAINDWQFLYVNCDESSEITGQHLVFAVPTILLFADGREAARFSRNTSIVEIESTMARLSKLTAG